MLGVLLKVSSERGQSEGPVPESPGRKEAPLA